MEAIIPFNVLKDIFTEYLCVDDTVAVYNTCTYWRNIIDNFNIWQKHWTRLVVKAQKSCLKQQINQLKPNPIELQHSCVKLEHILSNKYINSCFCNHHKRIDVILLKTHHSHYLLTYYDIEENADDTTINYGFYKPILNPNNRDHLEYVNFRSPQEIIKNNDRLNIRRANDKQNNVHHSNLIKQFLYVYPIKLGNFIEVELMRHLFEVYHVQEVVFVPRVLMLCENLNVSDALVIYSTSQTTEIAVVLNGCVGGNRWCELPIGGWNVSKNLHNAIKWIYPNIVQNVCELEDVKFKNLCWIKPTSNMSDNHLDVHTQINDSYFTLKKEQYLAAELMYTELNLCSVVKTLLDGLSDEDVANCLSHVFLTGGNCKLKHLSTRIKLDLIEAYPKYENIISTSVHCAQSLIYELSNNIYSFITSSNPEAKFSTGKVCKIRIEDYILQNK